MAVQALIPGVGYVEDEFSATATQALVPGAGYVNETAAASTTPVAVFYVHYQQQGIA